MNELLDRLVTRWRALAGRERMLVGAAAAMLLLTVGQLLWRGGHAAIDGLRADVASLRAASALAQTLDATGPAAATSDVPLLTVAERSAREVGVGATLKRLDGGEGGRVRAHLEAAPFGTLVRWLAAVQAGSGASIESLTLQRGAAPGLVDANVVLLPAGR